MGAPPGLFAELARWRSKAQKRGGICTFTSDIIPEWLNAEVTAAFETVGVAGAFAFLKAKPETRDQIEKRLRKKLDALLAKFKPRVARAIRLGEQPDYDRIFEEMRAAIQPEVTQLTTTEALRLSVDTGIVFDPAVINTHAVEWARTYTYNLVTGITNTSRKLIAEAQRTFFETPGMTQGDLEKILEHAFGPVRAEMIATTEATRAASEATNEVQRLVNEVGVPMTRQWHTANDDIVCPICGPLNGQPESVWSGEFPGGPPAHVNCRCSTGLTVGEEEELLAEARVLAAERDGMLREMGILKPPVFEPATTLEGARQQALGYADRVDLSIIPDTSERWRYDAWLELQNEQTRKFIDKYGIEKLKQNQIDWLNALGQARQDLIDQHGVTGLGDWRFKQVSVREMQATGSTAGRYINFNELGAPGLGADTFQWYASQEPNSAWRGARVWGVSETSYGAAKHELMHVVEEMRKENVPGIVDQWYSEIAPQFNQQWRREHVSAYAAGGSGKRGDMEFLAESAHLFTQPGYEAGYLPDTIEQYLGRFLGGAL